MNLQIDQSKQFDALIQGEYIDGFALVLLFAEALLKYTVYKSLP